MTGVDICAMIIDYWQITGRSTFTIWRLDMLKNAIDRHGLELIISTALYAAIRLALAPPLVFVGIVLGLIGSIILTVLGIPIPVTVMPFLGILCAITLIFLFELFCIWQGWKSLRIS